MAEVACRSRSQAQALRTQMLTIPGVEAAWPGPTFHEFALRLPLPAASVIRKMTEAGILAGVDVSATLGGQVIDALPDPENVLLVAVTEKRTDEDLKRYLVAFSEALAAGESA